MLITAEDFQETLKKEIEAVAAESKHLADELADMLLGMEVDDLKEKTNSKGQHNESIENTIDAMEARIKKLEDELKDDTEEAFKEGLIHGPKEEKRISKSEALRQPLEKLEMIVNEIKGIALSDDSEGDIMQIIKDMSKRISDLERNNAKDYSAETPNESVKSQHLTLNKQFTTKEESLRGALNKFKSISRDLENLKIPTETELNSENKFGKILKAMTTKLSLDEMKISIDLAFGKGKKMKIVKNDFETMIDSLVGVAESLDGDKEFKVEVGDNEDGDHEKYEGEKYENEEEKFEGDEYENYEYEDIEDGNEEYENEDIEDEDNDDL